MGLDQSNPNKPATADTSIQWPDSHKWDEVEYGLHQEVLNSNSGKQKMRRFRTGQDLSLQDFWKDKRRRGYGAGPARRAQRKLKPFILSNYGRWLQETKSWTRALCQKAVRTHLKGGIKGGVIPTRQFQGPAMSHLGRIVGVKRMQGNLRVYESSVGHLRPGHGGVGSPPAYTNTLLATVLRQYHHHPGRRSTGPTGW